MSNTMVSDIIVPEKFARYVNERTSQENPFVEAGIVETGPQWDDLASRGGRTVNMPFWRELIGIRQVLSDGQPLVPGRFNTGQDIACIHNDGYAISMNNLVPLLSGDDPVAAMGGRWSDFWVGQDTRTNLAILAGIMASASMAGNVLRIAAQLLANVGDSTRLNAGTFVDATARLGDQASRLTALIVNSQTEAALRKQDQLVTIPGSEGKPAITMYQGRRLLVNDALPIIPGEGEGAANTFVSYLCGRGAFVRGNASLSGSPVEGGTGTEAVEFGRAALAGDSFLINRRRYILHPRGVAFTSSSVAGQSPTNEELADGANWQRAWENKNIPIIAIYHNN